MNSEFRYALLTQGELHHRLYGLPSWEELCARMLKVLAAKNIIDHNKVELLGRQSLKTRISIADYYFKRLADSGDPELTYRTALFGTDPNPNARNVSAYNSLAKCGVKFVTTNYDNFLAEALKGTARVEEVIKNPDLEDKQRDASKVEISTLEPLQVFIDPYKFSRPGLLSNNVVFHLHGSINDEKTIVASTLSYLDLYSNENVQTFLRWFFEKHVVVFIGYGLEELEVLDLVIRAGRPSPGQRKPNRFFLLLPILSHEVEILNELREYYRQLNIELIPFSRDKKNYESYAELLDVWAAELAKLAKKPTRVDSLELIDSLVQEFEGMNNEK